MKERGRRREGDKEKGNEEKYGKKWSQSECKGNCQLEHTNSRDIGMVLTYVSIKLKVTGYRQIYGINMSYSYCSNYASTTSLYTRCILRWFCLHNKKQDQSSHTYCCRLACTIPNFSPKI